MNFKDIHIGSQLKQIVDLNNIQMERILKFFKIQEVEVIEAMYEAKSIDTEMLFKWSKLLDYNFFLIYHTHLSLFSSSSSAARLKPNQITEQTQHLQLKKNIYTKEIKDHILNLINTKELTIMQAMSKYNIPKTTIYKWVRKQSKTTT